MQKARPTVMDRPAIHLLVCRGLGPDVALQDVPHSGLGHVVRRARLPLCVLACTVQAPYFPRLVHGQFGPTVTYIPKPLHRIAKVYVDRMKLNRTPGYSLQQLMVDALSRYLETEDKP